MWRLVRSSITRKLIAYLRLTRWEDYLTFLQMVVGYMLGCNQYSKFSCQEPSKFIWALIIFAPILYGGIYALNDLVDLERDALHSVKKNRPLPLGEISIGNGKLISTFHISLALITSFFLSKVIFIMVIIFLVINIFYIFVAKHIPYLEFVINSITHPLRFYFGLIIAWGSWSTTGFIMYFLGVNVLSIWKRIREIDEERIDVRPTLKYYNKNILTFLICLSLAVIVLLVFMSVGVNLFIGVFWIVYDLLLIYGYRKFDWFKKVTKFAYR